MNSYLPWVFASLISGEVDKWRTQLAAVCRVGGRILFATYYWRVKETALLIDQHVLHCRHEFIQYFMMSYSFIYPCYTVYTQDPQQFKHRFQAFIGDRVPGYAHNNTVIQQQNSIAITIFRHAAKLIFFLLHIRHIRVMAVRVRASAYHSNQQWQNDFLAASEIK